jgi:hypothetical protein
MVFLNATDSSIFCYEHANGMLQRFLGARFRAASCHLRYTFVFLLQSLCGFAIMAQNYCYDVSGDISDEVCFATIEFLFLSLAMSPTISSFATIVHFCCYNVSGGLW